MNPTNRSGGPVAQMEQLLTPTQLAEWLQVSASTIRSWRAKGTGPVFLRFGSGPGADVRYRRSDVEQWLVETGR